MMLIKWEGIEPFNVQTTMHDRKEVLNIRHISISNDYLELKATNPLLMPVYNQLPVG